MDVYIYLTHGNLVDIKTVCNGILICACIPLTWLLVYKNTMKETEFYINTRKSNPFHGFLNGLTQPVYSVFQS